MTGEWSNKEVIQFLQFYQNEGILWNTTHKHYKNKAKTEAAWVRLGETINRPVDELKKKKDTLMATFRGHLRKKKASITSGATGDAVYNPVWFAFGTMESFLAPNIHSYSTTEEANAVHEALVETVIDDTVDCGNSEGAHSPQSSPASYQPVQIPAPRRSTRKRRKKQYLYSPESREVEQQNETFPTVEEDECDLYGKMLAIKLRKLDEVRRQLLMHRIDGAVIDTLMNQIGRPSPTTTPGNYCSRPSTSSSESYQAQYSSANMHVGNGQGSGTIKQELQTTQSPNEQLQ